MKFRRGMLVISEISGGKLDICRIKYDICNIVQKEFLPGWVRSNRSCNALKASISTTGSQSPIRDCSIFGLEGICMTTS